MIKRGQLDLSFGFIFSIIVIAVTIAVAFYAISHFLSLNKCTQTANFYKDLQDRVDKAWQSDISQGAFNATIPGSVTFVCFGNLNQTTTEKDKRDYLSKIYFKPDKNLFLYPKAGCEELKYYKISHVKIDSFFCVPVIGSKALIKYTKNSNDSLVSIIK